jgi:lipopolysaccharide export system permease protein
MGSLGMVEILTPVMAAWLPNVIGVGIGIYLIYEFNQ